MQDQAAISATVNQESRMKMHLWCIELFVLFFAVTVCCGQEASSPPPPPDRIWFRQDQLDQGQTCQSEYNKIKVYTTLNPLVFNVLQHVLCSV